MALSSSARWAALRVCACSLRGAPAARALAAAVGAGAGTPWRRTGNLAASAAATSSPVRLDDLVLAVGPMAHRHMATLSGKALTDREARKKKKKTKKKGWVIKPYRGETVTPFDAFRAIKVAKKGNFDQSVDIALQLGVDPRKPDQNVRGVVHLPHGTGRDEIVAVFAKGPKAEEARAAGAQLVGAEDLVESIKGGTLGFTKCIATPDVMQLVGQVARILGPRGLMPNPKMGTVTPNVADAVQNALRGQLEFRAEKRAIVHASLGRASFTEEQLVDNLRAFMVAISNVKPDQQKGAYLRHATLSTTMGEGHRLNMDYLDPSSRYFMREL